MCCIWLTKPVHQAQADVPALDQNAQRPRSWSAFKGWFTVYCDPVTTLTRVAAEN